MLPKCRDSRFARGNHGLWGGVLADGFVESGQSIAQKHIGGVFMERKSIGQFIAALRKSRGFTQAQLAEMLNVSDKAVSRWERDESAPDLSLIPVIAEIFGVTSDEILRGERLSVEGPKNGDRPKKQMERLLNDAKTKFQIRSILSVGIAVIGLLAVMLCNFGFFRARIGFIVGCIFYVAAIGLEAVFLVLGLSAISDEAFEGQKLQTCKKSLIRLAGVAVTAIVSMFAISLPLITEVTDAFVGIRAGTWLACCRPYLLVALLLCGLVYWLTDRFLLKKGSFALSEKEIAQRLLRRKYALVLAFVLAVTFLGQFAFNVTVYPQNLAHAQVFYTPEDFIAYMEKNVGNVHYYEDGVEWIIEGLLGTDTQERQETVSFFDENGKETIYNYTLRNHAVHLIKHETGKNGATRCYKVYTVEALQGGLHRITYINNCWLFVYVLEAAVILMVYFRKRRQPNKK